MTSRYSSRVVTAVLAILHSVAVSLTLQAQSPAISLDPQMESATVGQTRTLAASVTGATPVALQWFSGLSGDTSAPVAGAIGTALALPALADSGAYWLRATNAAGSAASPVVRVLVWDTVNHGLGLENLGSVAYANGRIFVFGNERGAQSIDGVTWTPIPQGFALRPGGRPVFGHGRYVAGGGSTTDSIYVSGDGTNWQWVRSGLVDSVVEKVLFSGARFVAIGSRGEIGTSDDGSTWTKRHTATSDLLCAAAGAGKLVAGGYLGSWAVSTDGGATWTNPSPFTTAAIDALAFGAGRFVARATQFSQPTRLWTSTDGTTWTMVPPDVYPTVDGAVILPSAIEWTGSFFAGCAGRHLLVSEDGLSWRVAPNFFAQPPLALAWGNGRLYGAGMSGQLMRTALFPGPAAPPSATALDPERFLPSGQSAVLGVNAGGSGLSYQWYRGASGDTSQPIAGATAATYSSPAMAANAHYWVRVRNAHGEVDSATFQLVLAVAPSASIASAAKEIVAGAQVAVEAAVAGTPQPTLQWYRGAPGDVSRPIAGATGATLQLTMGETTETVWLRATNTAGSADSNLAGIVPWRSAATSVSGFASVAHGGGRFIALGQNAATYRSTDGTTWTALLPNLRNHGGERIAYADGVFLVTTSSAGAFYTSIDGEHWTARLDPAATAPVAGIASAGGRLFFLTSAVADVAYGAGRFVAVGNNIITSTDGTTWAAANAPTGVYTAAAYGAGKFVAVGRSGTTPLIATSPDGQSWTARTSPSNTISLNDIAFAGDRFLAVTSGGLLYSADGVQWQLEPSLGPSALSVSVAGNRVLLTGNTGTVNVRALDGVAPVITALSGDVEVAAGASTTLSVTASGSGLSYQWYRGASGDVRSPGTGATGPSVVTPPASSHQYFWVRIRSGDAVVDSPTVLVALAGPPRIVEEPISADVGADFASSPILRVKAESVGPMTFQWFEGKSGDVLNPVVGATGATLAAPQRAHAAEYWVRVSNARGSSDSRAVRVTPWTPRSLSPDDFIFASAGIAAGNGRIVVTGTRLNPTAGYVQISQNGATWNRVTSPILGSIAFGAGRFVALPQTASNRLHHSVDGETWTEVTVAGVSRLAAVRFAGDRFFALSDDNRIATSVDGLVWTVQAVGSQRHLGVAAGAGKFLLWSGGPDLSVSFDGVAWSNQSIGATAAVVGVTYGEINRMFIATTGNGTFFGSSNGVTWTAGIGYTPGNWTPLPFSQGLEFVGDRFAGAPFGNGGESYSTFDGFWWWPSVGGINQSVGAFGTVFGATRTTTITLTTSGTSIGRSAGATVYRAHTLLPLPLFTAAPAGANLVEGQALTLSATATSDTSVAYQWLRNGEPIPGATQSTFDLAQVRRSDAGTYTLRATNAAGAAGSREAVVRVEAAPGGIVAARASVVAGALVARGAFTVEGSTPKRMLIRAVGPALAALGVAAPFPDPAVSVVDAVSGAEVAANNDWSLAANATEIAAATTQVGATPLPDGSKDAAILATFAPGTYRVNIGPSGPEGTVSLEIYEADGTPRLVYLATRGNAGPGAPFAQALALGAPRAGRVYLLRALGPGNGHVAALEDPRLAVFFGAGSTALATNDDWGGDAALASAAATAGAMPLASDSKDSALLLTPGSAGVYSAQVSGNGARSGLVVLEVFEVDANRSTAVPAAIVATPASITVEAGARASLGIVATGNPPPAFQWYRAGSALPGATRSMLVWPAAQLADGGDYVVRVANGGAVAEAAATLTVLPRDNARHGAFPAARFTPAEPVLVGNALHYGVTPTGLTWTVTLPAGWSLEGDTATTAATRPALKATGTLTWTWTSLPPSLLRFSYSVLPPVGEAGSRSIAATVSVNGGATVDVAPAPLVLAAGARLHSADSSGDGRIDLAELLRVIALFNVRREGVRTGAYAVDAGGEEGFAPDALRGAGAAAALIHFHTADSNRDGRVSLVELTRVIELYNHRVGTTRTGHYRAMAGTEDGFAPGL